MYKKLPFRVIIYLLEFHALDINIQQMCIIKDITEKTFKIKDLFGYFKLDRFRKVFNLYKLVNLRYDGTLIKTQMYVAVFTKHLKWYSFLIENDRYCIKY